MSTDLGKLGNLLGQIQQMQADLEKVVQAAQAKEAEGSSGAGLVTVRANGRGEIVCVEIDPQLLAKHDAELLGDLVRGAANRALERARESMTEEVQRAAAAGGLPMALGSIFGPGGPGGFGGGAPGGS